MTKFSRGSVFKAVCFGIVLSFFQFSVFAQNSNQNQQDSSIEISDSSNQLSQSQDSADAASNQTANWNWSSQNFSQNQNQPSTIGLFFKMVFALALVIGIAYIALKVLRRSSKLSNSDDPFLRHVAHLALSPSRSVDVVTILDHAYILGVSDNNVNLVGELTDKELVNSMNLYADKNDNTRRPRSFEDILAIFMPKGFRDAQQNRTENVYGSTAWDSSELLRRQRERFNENEGGEE